MEVLQASTSDLSALTSSRVTAVSPVQKKKHYPTAPACPGSPVPITLHDHLSSAAQGNATIHS
jgi:hypothetical protein